MIYCACVTMYPSDSFMGMLKHQRGLGPSNEQPAPADLRDAMASQAAASNLLLLVPPPVDVLAVMRIPGKQLPILECCRAGCRR